MEVDIKPFPVTQTAVKLRLRITDTTKDTAQCFYELVRSDGRVMESGTQTVPISALAIMAANPVPKAALNQLLATWNLEAV